MNLLSLAFAAAFFLTDPAWTREDAPARFPGDSEKTSTVCFLNGSIAQPGKQAMKGGALGSMVRLKFEAAGANQCQTAIQQYCRARYLPNGYDVTGLGGYFKSNETPFENFEFKLDRICQVTRQKKR